MSESPAELPPALAVRALHKAFPGVKALDDVTIEVRPHEVVGLVGENGAGKSTLARIIALNKPYITTAPMEGLTAQTLESDGGLLFTTKKMLKEKVTELACNEELRMKLGENLKEYLDEVVSWDVVASSYNRAYELAREAKRTNKPVVIDFEF